MAYMLQHGFFGVALHTRVYRRKYLKTVGIDIVMFTVLLVVFIAPSIQRVCLPGY